MLCYVAGDLDEQNNPRKVALKLVVKDDRSQFSQEIRAREQGFSTDYVVNLLATYPSFN